MKSKFRFLPLICLVLCTALMLPLTACGQKLGTPLMSLDGQSLSANAVTLLMSRVKGNLALDGYTVTSSSLWDTITSSDGTTYGEFIRRMVLSDAKEYLAASVLFDEMKLSLPKATTDAIDEEIKQMISDSPAGSKNSLNQTLSEFGANIDILRALYITEAKYAALVTELYGAEGAKISTDVLQEYASANTVCFKQLMIRSYSYVYEKDANGDEIRYVPSENNGKVSNIAYDTVNGILRVDDTGRTIIDKNGDPVYFTANGHIAYDKVKGVRAFAYDASGNVQTIPVSSEAAAAHKAEADEVCAKALTGGPSVFESLLSEYAAQNEDVYLADGDFCFLYKDGSNAYDYLNDMADTLVDMEMHEARVISTEYGYHVLMKYPVPSDCVSSGRYNDWFSDLPNRVTEMLLADKLASYVERVTVDEAVLSTLPTMKEVGINYYY